MRATPSALGLCLIAILATISIVTSSFIFIKPISLPLGTSYVRRDIRIVSGDPATWSYKACIADSGSRGKIFNMNIFSNDSLVVEGVAPNNGLLTYDLTVIQGLNDCAYSGLVNLQLMNQVFGDTVSADLPNRAAPWRTPSYAVWLNNNNVVQTFVYSDDLVISRVNATTDGPHTFTPIGIQNMEMIFSWELYQEPTTELFYIAYSESRNDNTGIWNVIIEKCDYDCKEVRPLGGGAFATITANATHWFSCFKEVYSATSDHIIMKGKHRCVRAGLIGYDMGTELTSVDLEFPMNMTQNAPLYSCMIGSTTLILAVSDFVNQVYALYALDTANEFTVIGSSSSSKGNLTVLSMTCKDRVILVSTKNGIDYWTWDGEVSIPAPIVQVPLSSNVPSSPTQSTNPIAESPTDSAVTQPTGSQNQPTTAASESPAYSAVTQPIDNQPTTTTSSELGATDKILIGVLVGVGVPVMAAAIVLILMRKKFFKKKKKPEDKESIYSAIGAPDKNDPSLDKKTLIPYKQLKIGKTIGSGSFGKVFLGKWRGATVAIKMSNQFSSPESFSAEAKLTLSMPPHLNLVQTYGVCTDSEYPLIVLEYCEGGSLDKIVFNQTLEHKEQRALVLGIAYGLLHLHEHKVVHRDLAARNVLLKEGIPKICDFGMSRALKEESQGKTYSPIGPIRWMAPESVNDMSYSYKSDVWTFGIVVSEIVNGHEPYDGENQLDVAMKIRDSGLTPTISEHCDPVLLELMQMCWKIDPNERPTMNDLVVFLNNKFALSDE